MCVHRITLIPNLVRNRRQTSTPHKSGAKKRKKKRNTQTTQHILRFTQMKLYCAVNEISGILRKLYYISRRLLHIPSVLDLAAKQPSMAELI